MLECTVSYKNEKTGEVFSQKKEYYNLSSIKWDTNLDMTVSECKETMNDVTLALIIVVIIAVVAVLLITLKTYWKEIKTGFSKLWKHCKARFTKTLPFEKQFPDIIYYEKGDKVDYTKNADSKRSGEYIAAMENGTVAIFNETRRELDIVHYTKIICNSDCEDRKVRLLMKELPNNYFNTKLRTMRELNQEDSK